MALITSLGRCTTGLILGAAAVIVLVVLVATPARRALRDPSSGANSQLERSTVATMGMSDRPIDEFAIAPDGQRLAFTATNSRGERHLVVRVLTSANEQTIDGTEGASHPFWSGDSQFIAYFAEGELRTVSAGGGMAAVITDAQALSAGAWSGDVIVFSRDAGGGPLYRVSVEGGAAARVTGLRDGEVAHGWPVFLPGGERFLYTVTRSDGYSAIHVGALDGSESREVLAGASRTLVGDGYLVRRNALTVQPFDLEMLIPRGDPIQVSEGAPTEPGADGVRAFSLSAAGILVYQVGPAAAPGSVAAPVSIVDWRTGLRR